MTSLPIDLLWLNMEQKYNGLSGEFACPCMWFKWLCNLVINMNGSPTDSSSTPLWPIEPLHGSLVFANKDRQNLIQLESLTYIFIIDIYKAALAVPLSILTRARATQHDDGGYHNHNTNPSQFYNQKMQQYHPTHIYPLRSKQYAVPITYPFHAFLIPNSHNAKIMKFSEMYFTNNKIRQPHYHFYAHSHLCSHLDFRYYLFHP